MGSLPTPPMGGGAPGPMGGPPPAAGMPTLSNIPDNAPPPQDPNAAGGALPKLVFQIEQQIGSLARALPPGMSEKLDAIKESLRAVVAEALSGGAESAQSPTQQGGPY